MSDGIRVAVFDAQPLFREGVTHIVRSTDALKLVGEGETAADALCSAKMTSPDIVLLDASLPGGGIDAARRILEQCSAVKVIVISSSDSEEHVAQALEIGVHGYVLKGVRGSELVSAIEIIFGGDFYITPALAARLLRPIKEDPSVFSWSELTMREQSILKEVARGLTNKEIARNLAISDKTVKHYMTNIMNKLHVRNRVEAVLAVHKARASDAVFSAQARTTPPAPSQRPWATRLAARSN